MTRSAEASSPATIATVAIVILAVVFSGVVTVPVIITISITISTTIAAVIFIIIAAVTVIFRIIAIIRTPAVVFKIRIAAKLSSVASRNVATTQPKFLIIVSRPKSSNIDEDTPDATFGVGSVGVVEPMPRGL